MLRRGDMPLLLRLIRSFRHAIFDYVTLLIRVEFSSSFHLHDAFRAPEHPARARLMARFISRHHHIPSIDYLRYLLYYAAIRARLP